MAGISIKTDSETKALFTQFCDSVGITVSSAINIFMKATVRENRIPFEIRGQVEPSKEFLELMKELEANPHATGFGSTEELFDDDMEL